jgi:hypothetical protein
MSAITTRAPFGLIDEHHRYAFTNRIPPTAFCALETGRLDILGEIRLVDRADQDLGEFGVD